MLTRWQPFGDVRTELDRLHNEMNRLFGRYSNGVRDFSGAFPPLNLWEDDGNLYVEAELPGFTTDDIEMYVTSDNQLSLKGERKPPHADEGTWHRQERGFGAFSRTVDLPTSVNGDKVSADFKNGVLTITLPKQEAAKPRRIKVKAR
mgnify:CR=1 FL=1